MDLWVGEDFAFGHNRRGDRFYLEQEAEQRGFKLHKVPHVLVSGEIASSTRVREALRSGDVARVERYLGRPFEVPGIVVGSWARSRPWIPDRKFRNMGGTRFPSQWCICMHCDGGRGPMEGRDEYRGPADVQFG
jgi:hypothetical protein